MKLSLLARRIIIRALFAFAFFVAGVACAPGELVEPAHVVTPATKAACILIRAFVNEGTLREVCATAEDLAPLVEEIIAEREAAPAPSSAATTSVAFALSAPPRRVPRRRCVQWQHVGGNDSGPDSASNVRGDAGLGALGSGRSASGDDGGERGDGGR